MHQTWRPGNAWGFVGLCAALSGCVIGENVRVPETGPVATLPPAAAEPKTETLPPPPPAVAHNAVQTPKKKVMVPAEGEEDLEPLEYEFMMPDDVDSESPCRVDVCGDFGPVPIAWPLISKMSSGFGMRKKRLHAGIDVSAPKGTPVHAAADGQVLAAKRWSSYGIVVILGHRGNRQTLYAHLQQAAVRAGDLVKMGEVVGFVGRTGRASGYHLHFETRIDGYPVDPMSFLPQLGEGGVPQISSRW